MDYIQLEFLTKIIVVIACGCILPIVMVWLQTRRKISESKDRTQIVMAALEKNPDMDVEELIKKMAPQKKLLKEKLLTKLLWGSILTFVGIGILSFGIYWTVANRDPKNPFNLIAPIILCTGIAFLISFAVGKKMLAKEMEAEQAKLLEQA